MTERRGIHGQGVLHVLDAARFSARALGSSGTRTLLIMFATAIGVAAVVLLTALGEGGRRFVVGQFESLGTNLLIVLPGRNETTGGPPPMLGTTPRDLTIDDALALLNWRDIDAIAPVMVGNAPVSEASGLEREVTVLGSTAKLFEVRHLELAQGRFLPAGDAARAGAECVLGFELRESLFGDQPAVGRWVRIGDRRFRVIGVLRDTGVSVGVDFNDLAIVPVGATQRLFDRESLFRIVASVRDGGDIEAAAAAVHDIIAARHEGEDDVTVITQDSVVDTLGRILGTITLGVAGISAVSLGVAGILIMNVMLVSVAQRRAEIGLLRALGARAVDIRRLFMFEAILLAVVGALAGTLVGLAAAALLARIYPQFPVVVPAWSVIAACALAIGAGVLFGVLPARRAAALDPVDALARR